MPVIDPTKNVIELVAAAMLRQDDLREVEKTNTREVLKLQSDFHRELRVSEKERLDAIRKVDVEAVATAAFAADARASTLAKQVTDSAEALRSQVSAAAIASDVALKAALDPITKDIAELRKVQYENAGSKAQTVEARDITRDTSGTRGMWVGLGVAIFFSSLSTILAVVGLLIK